MESATQEPKAKKSKAAANGKGKVCTACSAQALACRYVLNSSVLDALRNSTIKPCAGRPQRTKTGAMRTNNIVTARSQSMDPVDLRWQRLRIR
eukprot:scaffold210691_cov47-Prasinocladus_malaysianus.AAC.3